MPQGNKPLSMTIVGVHGLEPPHAVKPRWSMAQRGPASAHCQIAVEGERFSSLSRRIAIGL